MKSFFVPLGLRMPGSVASDKEWHTKHVWPNKRLMGTAHGVKSWFQENNT